MVKFSPTPIILGLATVLLLALGTVGCSSAAPTQPAETIPAANNSPATSPAATSPPASQGQQIAQPTPSQAEMRVSSPEQPTEAPPPAAAGPESAPPATSTPATAVQPGPTTEAAAADTGAPEPPPTAASGNAQDTQGDTTAAATAAAVDAPVPEPEPEPGQQPEPESPGAGGFVIGEGSKATFTVNETLAWLDLPIDAVMQTSGLSGNIFLDGQPSRIDLDLHSMTSDSDRRDGYVRNRMFPNHRVATFTVTDLGDLPDPLPEGEVITREVPGELTILDVTKPIVFQVEARKDPGKLFVLGRTTFTWDELEIPPLNIPGRIQVKDLVRVEVLLSALPNTDS